jgi:hypothetical protein
MSATPGTQASGVAQQVRRRTGRQGPYIDMPEDMVGDVGINTTPGSDAHFPGTQQQPAWATAIADSSAITIQHFTIRKHCLLDCFHANLHPASHRFFFPELL